MKSDLYGALRRVWKTLRRNKLDIKEKVQTNKITIEEWQTYFEKLYKEEENNEVIPEEVEDVK